MKANAFITLNSPSSRKRCPSVEYGDACPRSAAGPVGLRHGDPPLGVEREYSHALRSAGQPSSSRHALAASSVSFVVPPRTAHSSRPVLAGQI